MLTCHVDLCNLDRLWAEQEEWSGSLKGARGAGPEESSPDCGHPRPVLLSGWESWVCVGSR